MAISPQRLIGTHDEAAKELLRRLLLDGGGLDGGNLGQSPRRLAAPLPAPTPLFDPARRANAQNPLVGHDAHAQGPSRFAVDTPPIVVNVGEPPPAEPAPTSTDYANRAVDSMERVAKTMPAGNYANAALRPELGIEALNRTGQPRGADEQPASVMTGVTYRDKSPEIPEARAIRIPTLADAAVSDSTVQLPMVDGPRRMVRDPAASMGEVARNENESDAAYAARKHRALQGTLRTASPDSKVTETPTGVYEAPPEKRKGLAGRALSGLLLALTNMRGSTPAAAAGSSLVNFLTGAISPGFERKVERNYQIQSADAQSRVLDEQEQRELSSVERRARTQQLQDYPRRQADDERDKRWGRREQQMRLLAASPKGFDPQHDEEHRKLQQEALADGQILPAIPPKATHVNQTPHTSTRSVIAGEYPGLKPGTKIRQIWNGTDFEDDLQNGKPVISAEPPEKPQTPDIRGELRGQVGALDADVAASQSEWDRHNSYVQQKQRAWQVEAAKRKAAAQAADPTGQTLEGKRSLKEWADLLRDEDPDYVNGSFDTSTTSRDWLARDLAEKKAALKQLRNQVNAEDRRPRQAAYSGDTFTSDQVKGWAKARGMSVAKARRMLEKEGATIQ